MPSPFALSQARKPAPILSPADLDPYKNLILFASMVVDGWFSGKHRSLDYGSSAEFAEFKSYQPGDPVSDIDWRVYARNRHLMIRKFREEKEMTGHLVVDVSGSMAFRSANRERKILRAARIAASLAYLMQLQGDKSSLVLFNHAIAGYVPPGSTRRHLYDLVALLEQAVGDATGHTNAHGALDLCVPLCKAKGSLVVISDFFTDLDRFFDAIAQFQHRGFRILLLHVIDPEEIELPPVALARFVDMESGEFLQVKPDEIRNTYRREMKAMISRLEQESTLRGIGYRILRTEEPYLDAIETWLRMRGKSASTRLQ